MIVGERKTCMKLKIHFVASVCVEFEAMNTMFTTYCAMYCIILKYVCRTLEVLVHERVSVSYWPYFGVLRHKYIKFDFPI